MAHSVLVRAYPFLTLCTSSLFNMCSSFCASNKRSGARFFDTHLFLSFVFTFLLSSPPVLVRPAHSLSSCLRMSYCTTSSILPPFHLCAFGDYHLRKPNDEFHQNKGGDFEICHLGHMLGWFRVLVGLLALQATHAGSCSLREANHTISHSVQISCVLLFTF